MTLAQAALRSGLDRAGIAASVGCAIHCLVAPFVILFAPAIGGWWASPTTHFVIALLVLPLAGIAMTKGYRSHHRRWILALGMLGAGFVILGTAFPWLEMLWANGSPDPALAAVASTAADTECTTCTSCCPSVAIDEETGAWDLSIPPASWLTMLGGISLVTAHFANLRCCSRCEENGSGVGPFCAH